MFGLKFKMLRRIYNKIEEYKMLGYTSLIRSIKLTQCSYPKNNIYYKLRYPPLHHEIVNLLRKNIDCEALRKYIYDIFLIDIPRYPNTFIDFFYKKHRRSLSSLTFPQHTVKPYRMEWFLNKYGFVSPSYSEYSRRMIQPTDFIRTRSIYMFVSPDAYRMHDSYYSANRVEFEDFIKIYKRAYKLYAWEKIISWQDKLAYNLILIPTIPSTMWKKVKHFVRDDNVIKCFLWSIGSMILIIILNVIGYVLSNLN